MPDPGPDWFKTARVIRAPRSDWDRFGIWLAGYLIGAATVVAIFALSVNVSTLCWWHL